MSVQAFCSFSFSGPRGILRGRGFQGRHTGEECREETLVHKKKSLPRAYAVMPASNMHISKVSQALNRDAIGFEPNPVPRRGQRGDQGNESQAFNLRDVNHEQSSAMLTSTHRTTPAIL